MPRLCRSSGNCATICAPIGFDSVVARQARKLKRKLLREEFEKAHNGNPPPLEDDLPLPKSPSRHPKPAPTKLPLDASDLQGKSLLFATDGSSGDSGEAGQSCQEVKPMHRIRKEDLVATGGKVTDPALRMQIVGEWQRFLRPLNKNLVDTLLLILRMIGLAWHGTTPLSARARTPSA